MTPEQKLAKELADFNKELDEKYKDRPPFLYDDVLIQSAKEVNELERQYNQTAKVS